MHTIGITKGLRLTATLARMIFSSAKTRSLAGQAVPPAVQLVPVAGSTVDFNSEALDPAFEPVQGGSWSMALVRSDSRNAHDQI